MRVVLVNPRGFCAGVRMAIEVVERLLALFPDRRIYVYHEIVHNRHVVERFRQRGVVFVDDVADVPAGEIVVFSAHGVSPAVRSAARARGLIPVDATCPLVTKVHSEAIRYARQGYQIVLIGHRDHQEVIGTLGEAPEAITVVETVQDVARLEVRDPDRLVYLTQTTLSIDDAAEIIAALQARFPRIKGPPSSDICYATTNRQHAVRLLAPQCDAVLVVGSANSSNSVRLTEIARNAGTPAYLLDDASGLRDEWFERERASRPQERADSQRHEMRVLLTAGASAPEDLVAGICRELLRRYGGGLEVADVFEEDVEFALPAALRAMMEAAAPGSTRAGADRVHLSQPRITAEHYGAVPLTISAASRQTRWPLPPVSAGPYGGSASRA